MYYLVFCHILAFLAFLSIIFSIFSVTRSCAQYYSSIALSEYKILACLPLKASKITNRRQTVASSKNIVNELNVDFTDINDPPPSQPIEQLNQQSQPANSPTTMIPSPHLTPLPKSSSQQQKNGNLQVVNSFNPFQTIKKAPFVLRNKRFASL